MKKSIKIISIILALIILGTATYFICDKLIKNDEKIESSESISNPIKNDTASKDDTTKSSSKKDQYAAPDFEVKNQKGFTDSLHELEGKPVVICFWASWDTDCKNQLDYFEKAFKKYGKDIEFMMINMTDGNRETQKTAKEFIKKNGYTFPVYFDKDFSAAENYSVSTLPTSYFVSKKGELMADAKGIIDFPTIEKGIEMINK